MFVNIGSAFLVKRFTASTPQAEQDLVETIRAPSGAGGAQAH